MPVDIVAAIGVAAMVIVSPETASMAILVLPLAAVGVNGTVYLPSSAGGVFACFLRIGVGSFSSSSADSSSTGAGAK